MVGRFDYNNNEVMNILNNPNYTEDQKKQLFEKYKSDLKEARRKEIIDKLNECAKNNPIITQEEYVNFLKRQPIDDLAVAFNGIERQLDKFSSDMQAKYEEYLRTKEAERMAQITPTPEAQETPITQTPPVQESYDIDDEIKPDITPTEYNENELSDTIFSQSPISERGVSDETSNLDPTVFEDKEVKEVMPEDIAEDLGEKGNARAIIISIIAIIIGMVIMYSIIKLK